MINTKEDVIKNVLCDMSCVLGSEMLQRLENVLITSLHGIKLEEECTAGSTELDQNEMILRRFITDKTLENLDVKSIKQYVRATYKMLESVNKDYRQVSAVDMKDYLIMYKRTHNISNTTLSNIRLYISSFYSWACDNGYAAFNPVKCIRNIKPDPKRKIYLNEDEKEKIRDACKTPFEKALIDFLLSTGLRVSELVSVDITDIDWDRNQMTILGKRKKYRKVFLTPKAKIHLIDYLKTRDDNLIALFVVNGKRGLRRLSVSKAEEITKDLGNRAEIKKNCTVHIFRKTMATSLHRNGCSIEYIKEILGHSSTKVTEECYLTIEEADIQYAFNKAA